MGEVMRLTELFGRYHRLIGEVASRGSPEAGWRSDLQEILRSLNKDCRKLSRCSSDLLHCELSNQIEHELLRCADPATRRVLGVALKHLEIDT